jgi:methyl-accepting chemotaxis protein
MPDNHSPPQRRREQTERLRTNPDHGREDAERDRGFAEEHMPAEAARNEAEQLRRLAEAAREQRDQDREALETIRQGHERLRETAETARLASEEARGAAEAARQVVVEAVRATADTLSSSLEQMKIVEEMRRTLREIRDVNTLDSN